MRLRGWLASIFGVVYLCFLALCSLSGPLNRQSPLAFLNSNIYLSSGAYDEDTAEFKAVVTAEDLPLLDEFISLRSADFSGSTCYDEMIEYEQSHPQIAVTYTVPLPCGVTADNDDTELDMSEINDAELLLLQSQLERLPKLQHISLGSGTEAAHLSFDRLSSIVSAYPSIEFTYGLSVLGQSITLDDSSLDLTTMTREDMDNILPMLQCMGRLKQVALGHEGSSALTLEEIAQLVQTRPDIEFNYSGSIWGVTYSLTDTALDLNHIKMNDEGAAVRKVLACMNKLKTLDMDYCGISNGAMEALRADFPNVDIIWRIWFGKNYSVRTDTDKILASKPSVGGELDDQAVRVLKYCTKVKYLDLGHNGDGGGGIGDISFVSNMPDLEVLIIAMNYVSDISPLANCHKLEYLELFSTNVSDLTPLSGISSLRHLNIMTNKNLYDISPLNALTGLERLWIGCDTLIPAEQVEAFKASVPNCQVDTTSAKTDSWRWSSVTLDPIEYYEIYHYIPRYELLRKQLGYQYQEYSFYWLDEKCGDPAPAQFSGMYGRAASGE